MTHEQIERKLRKQLKKARKKLLTPNVSIIEFRSYWEGRRDLAEDMLNKITGQTKFPIVKGFKSDRK